MKPHEICGNCRFFYALGAKTRAGKCQRYPPTMRHNDLTIVVWPHVTEDQGCGEFDWDQSKPEYNHWLSREAYV